MGNILKNLSILQKFLFINLVVFIVIIIITFFYLEAIQDNLINEKRKNHTDIINQTILNLEKSKVKFNEDGINEFLFSKKSRFPYFEKLDRVIFFDDQLSWIGDTRSMPSSALLIEELSEETNENNFNNQENKIETNFDEDLKKYYLTGSEKSLTDIKKINDQFFVFSIKTVNYLNDKGYILINENADNIITQIEDRENFIIRTALVVLLVILIFSYVLNRYFLKPIKNLVSYTKIIKNKDTKKTNIDTLKLRNDELGLLSNSLDDMTLELQKRISHAENFSTDLVHEIRNPLASLKSASEILHDAQDSEQRLKLINILSHDVQRIERLITDYSQMLKDEVALSKEKIKKLDIEPIIKSVVDDFNSIYKLKRGINIFYKSDGKNKYFIYGIENRIEQIIANLLDNAISFSEDNKDVIVQVSKSQDDKVYIKILDEGQGFKEKDTNKIFKRFYSNRPDKFGQHSGLGLNIVKNLVDLHNATIKASNRQDKKGASMEIEFPKV